MKTRSEAREMAVKILYKINIYEAANIIYDVKELIAEECDIENDFVNSLINGVLANKENLTTLVNKYMKDWKIERLNKVDQAIFLAASFELTKTNTPSIVTINEWVEISKKYSDDKVTSMLNGVLDNIFHSEVEDEQ